MHRIDGAGHVNHLFVAEDVDTQRPPTEITPEIMNAFQEELASFIEWAGLVLSKADNTQLQQALNVKFAQLESPEFTGNPKAPTAELGDADNSLANTEFVHLVVAAALTSIGLDRFALLSASQAWSKGQRGIPALAPATIGTITLDLSASNNWEFTPTGNFVLGNPSSMPACQSGVIRAVDNGAVSVGFGSYWKPADGASLPTMSGVVGASVDFVYYVETATRIVVGRAGGAA